MRRTLILVCMCAIVLLASTVLAEDEARRLGKTKVSMVTGETRTVYESTLHDDSLTGVFSLGDTASILLRDIDEIYAFKGTSARQGGAVGMVFGAGFGLWFGFSTTADERYERNNAKLVFPTIAFCAVGGIIGSVIGSFNKEWERVRLAGRTEIDPGTGTGRLVFSLSF